MKRSRGEREAQFEGSHEAAGDADREERFFIDSLPAGEDEFEIRGAEAAHAAGSRRMRAGGFITLFDGSGWDLIARIVEASPKRLILRGVERKSVGPPTDVPITCAASLPKGSREDLIVSQCAQLGVTRFVPVEFERSVVRGGEHWDYRRKRFRRLAIEAAKQSGASTVMEMGDPVELEGLLKVASGLRLVGAPEAAAGVIEELHVAWPFGEVVFLVGPEGGMTDGEMTAAAEAGFKAVRLSATTLRIETACVAFASVAAVFLAGRPKG